MSLFNRRKTKEKTVSRECRQCKKLIESTQLTEDGFCTQCAVNPMPYYREAAARKELVGSNTKTFSRILQIEQIPDEKREMYFSVYLPTGHLCITDHTYAGGYGGGYTDHLDQLVRFGINYDTLIDYCRNTSPILTDLFQGANETNICGCLENCRKLPQHNRYISDCVCILKQQDFQNVQLLHRNDHACVYLSTISGQSALVLECMTFKTMINRWCLKLKDVDLSTERTEQLIDYAKRVLSPKQPANNE